MTARMLFGACGLCVCISQAIGQQQTRVWQGLPGGNYNVAVNWNPGGVPSNAGGVTYAVIFPQAASCVGNASATVDKVALGEGALFAIGSGVFYTILGQTSGLGTTGLLTNDGTLSLNAGAGTSDLRVSGSGASLTHASTPGLPGSARIAMSNSPSNRISGSFGSEILVLGESSRVEGAGQIGLNTLEVRNAGEIRAVGSAGLHINPNAAGITNTGMMRALTGDLRLEGPIANATGTIWAEGPAQVLFQQAEVTGGVIGSAPAATCTATSFSAFNGVTIDGTVNVPNGATMFLEDSLRLIDTGASLQLNSLGGGVDLSARGIVTVIGPGEIRLSNATGNRLVGQSGTGGFHLTQSARVRGAGTVGNLSAALTLDQGTLIEATGNAGLIVVPSSGGCISAGTLSAADGTLTLSTGLFDQSGGGQIVAFPGATVLITSQAVIRGGTVQAGVGGMVRAQGSAELDSITNLATIDVQSGPGPQTVFLRGALTNEGQIRLNSPSSGAELRLRANTTLSGAGVLLLGNSANNRVSAVNTSFRLTNAAQHTIRGAGQIAVNTMGLTNHGLIEAEGSAGLAIQPSAAAGAVNTGTLRARSASTLTLRDALFENSGQVEAQAGGRIILSGASAILRGGTLSGAGQLQLEGAGELHNVVSNGGSVFVFNGQVGALRESFTNNGTITMVAGANQTVLRLRDSTVIDGTGIIALSDSLSNRITADNPAHRLTLGTGQTLRGSGVLGGSTTELLNLGEIVANSASGLTISSSAGGFENRGLLLCTALGQMTISGGPFTLAAGELRADATRRIERFGDLVQTGGVAVANGEFDLPQGLYRLQGGTLTGTGLVDADLLVTGGAVEPGASPGVLTIDGTYTQQAGTLRIELGGTNPPDHDRLVVSGTATLGGTLDVVLANGFTPVNGQTFTVLTAGSRQGQFATLTSSDGILYTVQYTPLAVVVTFAGPSTCPADFNADGTVDPDDLSDFIAGFFAVPPDPRCDLNGDGTIDPDDLADYIAAFFGPPC